MPPAKRWSKLTAFQHLMLLRSLRPDKFISAAREFVACHLGPEYLEPVRLDMNEAYQDTSCETPLVFLLAPGSDPVLEILNLADAQSMRRRTHIVSLGKG